MKRGRNQPYACSAKENKIIKKKIKIKSKVKEVHRGLLQTETDTDTDTDRSYTAGLRRFGNRSRAELSGESIPYLVRLDLDLDLGCMRVWESCCTGAQARHKHIQTTLHA